MIGSAVSIICVTTILVGAQIHQVSQASTLPLQTDQCDVQYFNNFTTPATTSADHEAKAEIFWMFRLSFMYYSLAGLIVMLIVSHIASRLTGGASQDLEECLLLPYFQSKEHKERMCKMIKTQYTKVNQHVVELKVMSQNEQTPAANVQV